jgi:hypothetical protein
LRDEELRRFASLHFIAGPELVRGGIPRGVLAPAAPSGRYHTGYA